ncbi:MAG: hypothetical protein VKJ64_08510, partial [Leptolyngbyaceae bacterium]|nr:hypothetical protein [Leptolyngbyaceae bacterium]
MTQELNRDTVLTSSPGDGDRALDITEAPSIPSTKKRGGFWHTAVWGGTFVLTAIASTAVGIVLGLTVPLPN